MRRSTCLFHWSVLSVVFASPFRFKRDLNSTDSESDDDGSLIPESARNHDSKPATFTEEEISSGTEKTAETTIHFKAPKEDCGYLPELENGFYDCDTSDVFQDGQQCTISCDSGLTSSIGCRCTANLFTFKMFIGCRWDFGTECDDLNFITTTSTTTTFTTTSTTSTTMMTSTSTSTTSVTSTTTSTTSSTMEALLSDPNDYDLMHSDGNFGSNFEDDDHDDLFGHDDDHDHDHDHGYHHPPHHAPNVGYHGPYQNHHESYVVHILALTDQVKQLQAQITTQKEEIEHQHEELEKISKFEVEVSTVQDSLKGGIEFVEGFFVVRSNQLSLLTPDMKMHSIRYVTEQVEKSDLVDFEITNIVAITQSEAMELKGDYDDYNTFDFFFKVSFSTEIESTGNPVIRERILSSAFSTVPGVEQNTINIDHLVHRNNRDLRIDLLERRLDEMDHYVTKNVTQLNYNIDNLYEGIHPIEMIGNAVNKTQLTLASQKLNMDEITNKLRTLESGQASNEWNLESLADQLDRLDERGDVNQYLRGDLNSLKEQQNLQEIKSLMMSQELQRIITVQDQKISKQAAELARVQAALIEERYLKRVEMADYERKVRQSINLEMEIVMAKLSSFFDSKVAALSEQDATSKLFFDLLNTKKSEETLLAPPSGTEMRPVGPPLSPPVRPAESYPSVPASNPSDLDTLSNKLISDHIVPYIADHGSSYHIVPELAPNSNNVPPHDHGPDGLQPGPDGHTHTDLININIID